MTAQALLEDLQQHNIQLRLVDNELKVRAPKGMVTGEIRVLLVKHKAELMVLLSKEASGGGASEANAPAPIASAQASDDQEIASADLDPFSDVCSQCGAEVEYYSELGKAYCEEHRFQLSNEQCHDVPGLSLITQQDFFILDLALISEQLRTVSQPVALDLETTGLDSRQNHVVAISLGIPGCVYVIDMRPYYGLKPDRQADWRRALVRLFEELANVTWIGHNIKFDWGFLAAQFGVRLPQVYDTMLMEQLLHAGHETPGGFFTLSATAGRYRCKVSKQQRNWFIDLHLRSQHWQAFFPRDQLVYMVQDIEVPHRIADQQRSKLAEHELEKVAQLENQALPAIASMELHGILIDRDQWQQIIHEKQAQRTAIEQELSNTLGAVLQAGRQQKIQDHAQQYKEYQSERAKEENRLSKEYINSGKAKGQSRWERFRDAGLKAWDAKHPEPRKPQLPSASIKLSSPGQVKEALGYLGIQVSSTEEDVLEAYTRQYPIIKQLLAWRKLNHFCHSFGDNMLAHIKADKRIHATFFQASAVSGRITCKDPNLQQIPKRLAQADEGEDVRRCFIAPEGSRLLTADLSNIELRILAEISGDETMLQLFAQGKDMHAETARAMFGLSADSDTRQHLCNGVAVRDIAKTINFGLIYGMGVQGLANRIGVSTEEAQKLIRTYFATYAGIDRWLRQIKQEVIKNGYATTLAGRKRFFNLASTDRTQRATAERAAKNHPIQGTNADILKRALALLYAALPECIHLLLCVHDEIVLECPEDLVVEGTSILKASMVQACRDFLKVVAIPEPEVVVGKAWVKK